MLANDTQGHFPLKYALQKPINESRATLRTLCKTSHTVCLMCFQPEALKINRSSGMAVLGAGIMPCWYSFDILLDKPVMEASTGRRRADLAGGRAV